MIIGNILAVFVARRYDRKVSFLTGTWMAMIFGILIMVFRPSHKSKRFSSSH